MPAASRGPLLLLLFAVLFAGGCSVVGSLYERVDTLATLEADRWFALDAGQEQRFRAAMGERLEQNRREELPRYVNLIRNLAEGIERGADSEQILVDIETTRALMDETIRRSLPALADTMASLGPEQVERFEARLEERNVDYTRDYIEADPAERASARREMARKAVERWSGRLDSDQRATLDRMVDSIPDGSRPWNAFSLDWQRQLLAALRAGTDARTLEGLLVGWWVEGKGFDPAYAAQLAANRQRIAEGLADLLVALRPEQRARAAGRLRTLADDLHEVRAGDEQLAAHSAR